MTELGTALRELADRQQPVGGQEPGELWSRGRQRVRRRRTIGAGVALVLVAAVGTSALLIPAPTIVMPAGEPHAPAIPKDIYTPTQHLAGTAEKGPLGQIAVMAGAERDKGLGLFGISARTGEYRFLDLPDAVPGPAPALSPDGNHIAYWYGPYPHSTPPPGDALAPAHGAAVYDTRTGAVVRDPILNGVVPEALTWFDESTAGFSYHLRTSSSSTSRFTVSWRLGTVPRYVAMRLTWTRIDRNRDGSYLLDKTPTSLERNGLRNGALHDIGPMFTLPDPATPQSAKGDTSYSAVSISGNRVLAVPAVAGALSHPLMVGSLTPGSFGTPVIFQVRKLRAVGQLQETLFLGWRDDHTALVVGTARAATPELFEADLSTRKLHRLGVAEPEHYPPLVTVATDLVSQPLVAGRRPPNPQLPVAWLALAGLLVVAGVLWMLRRRRRA